MIDNRAPQHAPPSPTARGTRDGFALPMTILVIAFLTVTIAAAYAATTSELATNTAQRSESKAYMLAQAGMENFMARRNEGQSGGTPFCASCGAPPVTTYESTTVTLPGGYAVVVTQQVRTATDTRPAIYLMRSRGVDTSSVVNGRSMLLGTAGTGVRAERTVGMLVFWNVNQVNVLSGWTAANGFDKNGSSGTISGVDACSAAQGGGKPSVAGIAVPTGDYTGNSSFTPEGNPAITYLDPSTSGLSSALKIDWDGIVNGNRIQPDMLFANNSAAQSGWPTTNFANGSNYFPVIRVNGDFTLPTTGGQGTLIVMGNLTMSGNNLWHGIILVGGQMTSNGNGTVNGAVESGLNRLLTSTQLATAQTLSSSTLLADPPNATANGTKTFQYNSCDVARAAGGLASYSVYSNAWMDNIVTY